jgi:PAS domain S-box-containing protein
MTTKNPGHDDFADPAAGSGQAKSRDSGQVLRQRAEEITRDKTAPAPEDLDTLTPEEARKVLHELQVYQVELEMRNEELRSAQLELEASRARYMELYDLAPVGYLTVSEQGLILQANLTAAKLLGVARDALVRRPLSRFILPEDQDVNYRHRQQLFATGAPQVFELRMMRVDAAPFWVRIEAVKAQGADGVSLCRAVVSDVTERRRMEERLRESENHLRRVLDNTVAMTGILSLDGILMEANRTALEATQLTPQDVLGKPFEEIYSWAWSSEVQKRLREAIIRASKGVKIRYDDIIRVGEGQYLAVDFMLSPLLGANGQITHLIASALDITERKRAEAALQERIKELTCLYDISALLESPGISLDEILHRTVTLIPPAWQFPEITEACIILAGQSFQTARFRETLWMQTGVILANGKPVGQVEVCYLEERQASNEGPFLTEERYLLNAIAERLGHVVERRRAEDALRESEECLEFVLKGSELGFWDWNLETNEVKRNERWAEMLGYKLQDIEFTVKQWLDFIHPDDRSKANQSIQDHLEGRTPMHKIEYRMLTKDGQYRWILDQAQVVKRDCHGRPIRMSGTHIDISERKLADDALQDAHDELEKRVLERTAELVLANKQLGKEIEERKHSEETLRQSEKDHKKLSQEFDVLLNAISDTLVLLSPDMKVLWTNNGTAYHVDAPLTELVGQCCHDLFYGRSAPCEDCPVVRCFQTGEAEAQVSSRGGRFLDKRAYPIKDGDQVSSAILLVSDITEKMSLQAEAMQANHLASLGELAAGVAHEINNPINGIINYAQILINECGPGSLENDMGQRIVKEGDRIADIVRSLLSFARGGREDKRLARVDAILKESLTLTQAQIRKESIRLETYLDEDLPEIEANFQQIQQVFLNLISNARYAIHEKYPGRNEDKVIEIRGERVTVNGWEHVRITFKDRGVGISADKMSLLTKPFFSTKPFGKGTGLGLAIAHRIVKDHGGQICFESVEGEFTRVTVDLPAKGFSSG